MTEEREEERDHGQMTGIVSSEAVLGKILSKTI